MISRSAATSGAERHSQARAQRWKKVKDGVKGKKGRSNSAVVRRRVPRSAARVSRDAHRKDALASRTVCARRAMPRGRRLRATATAPLAAVRSTRRVQGSGTARRHAVPDDIECSGQAGGVCDAQVGANLIQAPARGPARGRPLPADDRGHYTLPRRPQGT